MDQKKKIVVAGGSGDLGSRICRNLIEKNIDVHVIVRRNSDSSLLNDLKGITIHKVDYSDSDGLANACEGAHCVVSALSGLREVIIDAQSKLLQAAVLSGVPRFIPSDFCIDYRPLQPGTNRNLDLRREFSTILDAANIKQTSILNGMFTGLLKDQAPVILKKQKRIFFWGNADQTMDFTTIDNTAVYTAAVAVEESSPRWLTIAGDVASIREIQFIATQVYRKDFRLLRPGGLKAFRFLIKIAKVFDTSKTTVFPAWQGMQYLHDMLSGIPKFKKLDNDRHKISWTSIKNVLSRA